MKGQAFVAFPSVELAQHALEEVNGYILRDKPMVIVRITAYIAYLSQQFRAEKKK